MSDRERSQFGPGELAVVLSHYDVGVIESVTVFNRGSPQSPKIGIVAARGKFLLKRRSPDKRSPRRTAFAHAIHGHLSDRGFPTAAVVPTRDRGEGFIQIQEDIYELFEFIPGDPFSATPGETADAGAVLARFHSSVRDFAVPSDAPRGTYHDVNAVRTALNAVPASISSHDSVAGREADVDAAVACLYEDYDRASESVLRISAARLPAQIVHADWHPGNLLFRRDRVVAVLDFDSCRFAERVTDVANALLHFSLLTGGPPTQWPDHLDEARLATFAAGYAAVERLDRAEWDAVPHLMIEAVIAESVLPIVQTGNFGGWSGYTFLQMVRRKTAWLGRNAARVVELISTSAG